MSFASPLWLLGLLPWGVVALYLLWGRRKRRDVPFLELWRGPAASERAKWKVSAPPIALAMALLALLGAILGAARPGISWGAGSGSGAVTVILDRGLTLSARGSGDLRFRETGRKVADEISNVFGDGTPIEAWTVPSVDTAGGKAVPSGFQHYSDAAAWQQSLAKLSPTAIDLREEVQVFLRRALADRRGPVVVISDAALGKVDSRVVPVAPARRLRNVGIALLSARLSPRPQVMVRVRNDSPAPSATLEVNFGEGGDSPASRIIDLPLPGNQRDYFFDARHLGSPVSATLIVNDDLEADNTAWVVRESNWPRIELARPAEGLARLADIYRRLHPPGEGSRLVRVVGTTEATGESRIIIDSAAAPDEAVVRPTRVVPHPITDAVRNWTSLDLPASSAKPPGDWQAILSAGERTLVAVQDSGSARQVWTSLDPAGWADRPEYVAFWTAAFDWAGGADSNSDFYGAYPLDQFDPSWAPLPGNGEPHQPGTWPGLYRRADGAIRAFNVTPPHPAELETEDPNWQSKLARLRSAGPGYRELSGIAMLLSMALILLAVATWRKAPRSDA